MVHEGLEGGRSIAESEEHDSGFKESHGHNKGSFPLISLPDVNVVIFPLDVKLGEQGGLLHVINEFWNEGERVSIVDSVGVQIVVVLAWAKGSILLWYEEEGGGLGGLQGYNLSCLKMFFDKGFACFHLCWVEGINFCDLRDEVWVKVDGVVIGMMRRELVMGFL